MRVAMRVAAAVVGAACLLLPWTSRADEGPASRPAFTESEIGIILSHGPWLSPVTRDPSNRVATNREAAELGTRLFFDPRVSGSGTVSCSSCHVPERNWTDNRKRGVGMAEVDRNTPTVANLQAQRWYGWAGSADSLWSHSLRAIVDQRELAASPRHVAELLRNDAQLSCRYRRAFGAAPSTDDEAVFVDAGKALAAFQETLFSGATPFDQFREALARGIAPSASHYSEPAQRGLKIFIGKGGCTSCHSGPNFTSGEFFNTGLSRFAPLGTPDPGRPAGIRLLLASSRFNLLGPYNDDPTGASAERTRQVTLEKASPGEFKVPSLRNLLLTAPYGRDGSVETLAEVVRHYSNLDPVAMHAKDGRPARRLDLTPREQTDLVVFLESLSTFSNPWRPDDAGHCD